MKKLNSRFVMFGIVACLVFGIGLSVAIRRTEAAPRRSALAAQAMAGGVTVDADNIGGVVTSSNGPEAGVWVIAETGDFQTKFRKIVVTDDQGRYLIPSMPKAKYKVWVRGYGLVDSAPVDGVPGQTLALKAVVAPDRACRRSIFPAELLALHAEYPC